MKDVKSQASKNPASGKQGGLNAEIQSRIGHQLRAMYERRRAAGVRNASRADFESFDVPASNPKWRVQANK